MIPYPHIDPVAIHLGPVVIRWYSLAYLGGIVLGWWAVRLLHRQRPIRNLIPRALDDMMLWAALGIVLGGRLGYVLFYKPDYYMAHPVEALFLWQGGMSFHGGMLGTALAFAFFARKYRVRFLEIMDVVAAVAPIGFFLGRLANFINGELYGRVTTAPWGMVFPGGGPQPRHPSQLYEAGLEGLALFALLFGLAYFTRMREKTGMISGLFLLGYAAARMVCEQFREPDEYLGILGLGLTMGQWLCVPMILVGAWICLNAGPQQRNPAVFDPLRPGRGPL